MLWNLGWPVCAVLSKLRACACLSPHALCTSTSGPRQNCQECILRLHDPHAFTTTMVSITLKMYASPCSNKSQEHGLLCSELKQLYVVATRAKSCVLFYESNQVAAKPMLDLWQAQGVIVCKEMGPEVRIKPVLGVTIRTCPALCQFSSNRVLDQEPVAWKVGSRLQRVVNGPKLGRGA